MWHEGSTKTFTKSCFWLSNTWENKEEYDKKARELARRFQENFKKFANASDDVKNAGPSAD